MTGTKEKLHRIQIEEIAWSENQGFKVRYYNFDVVKTYVFIWLETEMLERKGE